MTELKSCPFCGGKANPVTIDRQPCPSKYYIECSLCCNALTEDVDSLSIAIASWNTRADGWISVDKEKPTTNYVIGGSSNSGFVGEVRFDKGDFFHVNDEDWIPITKDITHWMSKPSAPRKSK